MIDRSEVSISDVDPVEDVGDVDEGPMPSSLPASRRSRAPAGLKRTFGRYRIIKRLGRGAMGSVYLAQDTQLERRVALKVPHLRSGGYGSDPDRIDLDRFWREARIAATLDHPNLCPVYDVGQVDGIPYLSMAYIKGRPLSDYIDPDRPMPLRRVAALTRRLALALEVAHQRGVIHRDLKPSNIMVNSRHDLVIMDFGVAWRIGSSDERLTKTGFFLGTPAYMSPEQLSGRPEALGPRCDVYSLGVIMYELMTACRPFQGQEAVVLGQILFIEPAPPSGHRPDLDPQIEAICLKAMAKRPEERYATMGELAAALGDYLRVGSLPSPPTITPATDSTDEDVESGPDAGAGEDVEPATEAQAEESGVPPAGGAEPDHSPKRLGPADEADTLLAAWRQWTAVVEVFALRRSRRHVDWQDYNTLHRELIEACRGRAAVVEESKRGYYRYLEDLVIPWLTPKALAQADREILFSLLLCCRQAEQEIEKQRIEELGPEASARAVAENALAATTRGVVWAASVFLALTIVAWLFTLTWSPP